MVADNKREILGGTLDEFVQMNKSFLEKEFVKVNSEKFEEFCKESYDEEFKE
jgi:hypothetical protein